MKRIRTLFLLGTVLGLALLPLRAEYTPPTEGQLDQLLANPKLINSVVKGASGADAADLILRIIARIRGAQLDANQKVYQIAFFTARVTFLLSPAEAQAMATELIPQVPADAMIPVLAGMSYGGGGSTAFISHVRELVQDNEVFLNAVNSPRSAMANPVHNRLVATLTASESLPPSVVDSLPPPIPVGDGEQPDEPPPVPQPYAGQGG